MKFKTFNIFKISILSGIVSLLSLDDSYAVFPTADTGAIKTGVETNYNIVAQSKVITEVKGLSGKMNSSIGSVNSSVSKLKVDDLDKIKEKAEKAQAEKERIEEKKSKIEKLKAKAEEAKAKAEKMKADAEKYKNQAEEYKSDAMALKSDIEEQKKSISETYSDAKDVASNASSIASSGINNATSSVASKAGVSDEFNAVKSAANSSQGNSSSAYVSSANKNYSSEGTTETYESSPARTIEQEVDEELFDGEGENLFEQAYVSEVKVYSELPVDYSPSSRDVVAENEENFVQNTNVTNNRVAPEVSAKKNNSQVRKRLGFLRSSQENELEVQPQEQNADSEIGELDVIPDDKDLLSLKKNVSIKPKQKKEDSSEMLEGKEAAREKQSSSDDQNIMKKGEKAKNNELPIRRRSFGIKNKIEDEQAQKQSMYYKFTKELAFAQIGTIEVYDNYINGKYALPETLVMKCEKNAEDLADIETLRKCIMIYIEGMNAQESVTAEAFKSEFQQILSEHTLGTAAVILEKKIKTSGADEAIEKTTQESNALATDERADIAVNTTVSEELIKTINDANDLLSAELIFRSLEGFSTMKPEDISSGIEEKETQTGG